MPPSLGANVAEFQFAETGPSQVPSSRRPQPKFSDSKDVIAFAIHQTILIRFSVLKRFHSGSSFINNPTSMMSTIVIQGLDAPSSTRYVSITP